MCTSIHYLTCNLYGIVSTVRKGEKRIILLGYLLLRLTTSTWGMSTVILNQGIDIRLNVCQFQCQISSFLQAQAIPLFAVECVCMAETILHKELGNVRRNGSASVVRYWYLSIVLLLYKKSTRLLIPQKAFTAISILKLDSSFSSSGHIQIFKFPSPSMTKFPCSRCPQTEHENHLAVFTSDQWRSRYQLLNYFALCSMRNASSSKNT